MKVIFATKNNGKLVEINEIMKNSRFQIVSMTDAGLNIDVIEDGDTFKKML